VYCLEDQEEIAATVLSRESERIPRSLTSTSSLRPELMAEGSRVAAGIFKYPPPILSAFLTYQEKVSQ
jgi:hypothetical protein